jgi:hypothetical protein
MATDFLLNRTGDSDLQNAADLAEELGGLPLRSLSNSLRHQAA